MALIAASKYMYVHVCVSGEGGRGGGGSVGGCDCMDVMWV